MIRSTRRQFLATAALGAAGFAGCRTRAKLAPFVGRELHIHAGGYEMDLRAVFVPRFEVLTGASVSLHSGKDAMAELRAAPAKAPPFDMVLTDPVQGGPAAKEGLFAELDLGNIPNHKNLVAPALDNPIFAARHGITCPGPVMTLAYNRKQCRRPPKTWSDLLMKDLAGKVGLSSDSSVSLYTFACVQADLDGKAGTARTLIEKDLESVLAFAKTYRDRVKLWWPKPADMIAALGSGEVGAGNLPGSECLAALHEKSDLAAVLPEKDRAFAQMIWSVPAGSPSKDLAERALDVLFSDEVQLGLARRGLATAVLTAAAKRAKEDALWKSIYPHTEEQFRSLSYYPYEASAAGKDRIAEAWERTVLRAG